MFIWFVLKGVTGKVESSELSFTVLNSIFSEFLITSVLVECSKLIRFSANQHIIIYINYDTYMRAAECKSIGVGEFLFFRSNRFVENILIN